MQEHTVTRPAEAGMVTGGASWVNLGLLGRGVSLVDHKKIASHRFKLVKLFCCWYRLTGGRV